MGRCYNEYHDTSITETILIIICFILFIIMLIALTGCAKIDPLKKDCNSICKQNKAILIGYQNTTNGLYCTCNNNGTTFLKRGD